MKINKLLFSQKIIYSLIDPCTVISWSSILLHNIYIMKGEVTDPFTFSYKTHLPLYNGLFCEKIFGTTISWKCKCNKGNYKIYTFLNLKKCNNCGIILSDSSIRRYKCGYIYLNSYFVNLLYIRYISLILNLKKKYIINLSNYKYYNIKYIKFYKLNMLSKISIYFFNYLDKFNILFNIKYIKQQLLIKKNIKYLIKKLIFLKLLFTSNIHPTWLLLYILPLLPPSLRPIYYFNSNKILLSTVNKYYLNIIIHNNKIYSYTTKYTLVNTLYIYIILEKKLLQHNLNKLFSTNSNILKKNKSNTLVTSYLGKNNKFRNVILGKRLNLSSRTTIVSSPFIKLNSIGIPINMAISMFKYYIILILKHYSIYYTFIYNFNKFNKLILNYIKYNKFILLNRAPTLHKLNIQSFKFYLTEGYSIRFNPLSCSAFNADFDGDQMSIFLPFLKKATIESKKNLNSSNNILNTLSGAKIKKFSQNLIIGLNMYNKLHLNKKILNNINVLSSFNELKYYNNLNELTLLRTNFYYNMLYISYFILKNK